MNQIHPDDLKAALQRNIINEQQLSSILHIAHNRQNAQQELHHEDEPFAIFLGFSEIFITIGLGILFAGVVGLLSIFDSLILGSIGISVFSFCLAHYFIKIRRMVLPSILCTSVLCVACVFGFAVFTKDFFPDLIDHNRVLSTLVLPFMTTVCLLIWMYRKYKLPYLTFLIGLSGLGLMLSTAGAITASQQKAFDIDSLMDLSVNPLVASSWLLFGIIALGFGLYFDSRDPYRVGNPSKAAFWLHLLSGPSLLNMIALNIFYEGDTASYILTTVMLCLFVVIALIIDRRSFISAGIVYLSFVVSWATENLGVDADFVSIIVLGLIITALATWWHKWRGILMRALPDFPFKDKLSPY